MSDHRTTEADGGRLFSAPGSGSSTAPGAAERTRFGPGRGKTTVKGSRITDVRAGR
ncbi:hypothetical protein [Streptomyces sp900116325]|uniref:Uncharacterized protein n=1 Tax=Streptomyces sp. 900116325 TaxID=3154295 RepID=A0ABV2UBH0_9ACTN